MPAAAATAHDFSFTSIDGGDLRLADYKGKVVLLVNTASLCGFTGQYEGLQSLWLDYKDRGLVVIGVPSDDFGGQEMDTAEQVKSFCTLNYGIDVPLADIAVVSALTSENTCVLVVVELGDQQQVDGGQLQREALKSVDPSVRNAELVFDNCPAQVLGNCHDGKAALSDLLDRAAVLLAFEQLGGADRCLELAVDYVKERKTFGRSVGSYQAVKHKLAKMYAQNELARSNAYYGAWALASESEELSLAASAARVSAVLHWLLMTTPHFQKPKPKPRSRH